MGVPEFQAHDQPIQIPKKCSAEDPEIRSHQQGSGEKRIPIRWARDHLFVHAGGRDDERSPDRLLQVR